MNLSHEFLKQLIDKIDNSIIVTDNNLDTPGPKILYVNEPFCKMTGYMPEEIIGKDPRILQGPKTSRELMIKLKKQLANREVFFGETINYKKDGTPFYLKWHIYPMTIANEGEFFVAVENDVTLNKEYELSIEKNLQEKELLLDEIHHRVKNNLQIMASLIELQMTKLSSSSDGSLARDSLLQVKNQLNAMSLLHQKLYENHEFGIINIKNYITSIYQSLLLMDNSHKIQLEVDLEDINLSIDQAIPIGLIFNELITNSLKYAFKDIENPIISISAYRNKENIELCYHDNGCGIIEEKFIPGLGTKIVSLLTKQLAAKQKPQDHCGFCYCIEFCDKAYSQ